mmetsp:Transcript_7538/g.9847  ORF Transcript_7538/g.9847 Transcript_7538/m.9847 type:complete len:479 (+) Transcript_7538:362-1798(+)|eukprot:CAMPEP_0198143296 /NCGR_PEP_ID=MMETSP1443-20131203/6268_1 /TAXON_ID=186043 /ORGANISM="Entomoneis sp., Strain CCMP2396" /LENGTH=478 /DNA_ID=CAMNT_0043806515 /DNA_START=275 /DNA_END=1711 /DNA_ORIENTATION=-
MVKPGEIHGNPPKLGKLHNLSDGLKELVQKAKTQYQEKLAYFAHSHDPPAYIVVAPGRVNLIGEHTDYTGGFVLPMALSEDYSTVVYGTGFLHTGKGTGDTTIRARFCSDSNEVGADVVEERRISGFYPPPHESEDVKRAWSDYVVGTIVQYKEDLPAQGCHLELCFSVTSSVPLGAGLSSSASLETAVAVFTECFLHDLAFSSAVKDCDIGTERALRCQKAENEWAHSPCGIMDQMVISKATAGNLLLIDCRDITTSDVPMKTGTGDKLPVVVITNSGVKHDIGDGVYGKRRAECYDGLQAMQEVPLYHVLSLRDATLQDVKNTQGKMDEVIFRRVKHVVTENQRTKEAKICLRVGTWDRLGELMNASHSSLKDDFEVSCDEVDFLVDLGQKYDGVYGSRMTGGGFGGSVVSLVQKNAVEGFIAHLKEEYKIKFDKECPCFVSEPGEGARVLAIDMDCKPESDFYKDLPSANKGDDS